MCRRVVLAALVIVLWLCPAYAKADKVTLAILNFETAGDEVAKYGRQAADLLTAMIPAVNPDIKTVERAKLDEILKELELSLTGVADETTSLKVGKLAGAQLLVTGRLFVVDDNLYVVAKIISTETGRVKAEVAKGPLSGKFDAVIEKLSQKVALSVTENLKDLLPAKEDEKEKEPAAIIAKALKGKKLPRTAVVVREMHIGTATVDPAVETELTFILKKCGFDIVGGKERELSVWAKDFLGKAGGNIPETLKDADVIVVGEAFSEFGVRTGNLVTCRARIELEAVDRETGKVLSVQRTNTRVADLSEHIAGKRALQKAAADVAPDFITEFVNAWAEQEKLRNNEKGK